MAIKHVAYAILGAYALIVADFSEGAQPDFMDLSLIGTMDDKNLIAESKQASSSVVRIIDNMYNIVSTTQENKVQKCCCFIATFYYGALISAGQIIKKKEKLDEKDLTELKTFVELTRNVSKNFSELAREMHDAYSTGIYRNCKSFNNTLDKALGFEFYEEKRTFNAMLQACDPYAPEENSYHDLRWYADELSAKANKYLENSGIAKRENVINTLRFIDSEKATETVSVVRYDVMCQKLEEEQRKYEAEHKTAEKLKDRMMEAATRLGESEAERKKQAKFIEDQKEELKKQLTMHKTQEESLEQVIKANADLKDTVAALKNDKEKIKKEIDSLKEHQKVNKFLLDALTHNGSNVPEEVSDDGTLKILYLLIGKYEEVFCNSEVDISSLSNKIDFESTQEGKLKRLACCKWIIGKIFERDNYAPLKPLCNFINSKNFNVSLSAVIFTECYLEFPWPSDSIISLGKYIEEFWEAKRSQPENQRDLLSIKLLRVLTSTLNEQKL